MSRNHCCNPLKLKGYKFHSKTLTDIPDFVRALFPEITRGKKYCSTCKMKVWKLQLQKNENPEVHMDCQQADDEEVIDNSLYREETDTSTEMESETNSADNDDSDSEALHTSSRMNLDPVNSMLKQIGKSPARASKLRSKKSKNRKLEQIESAARRSLNVTENIKLKQQKNQKTESDKKLQKLQAELVTKFNKTNGRDVRISILTVAAAFMSVPEMKFLFKTTYHSCILAKKLFKTKGILSTPDKRVGKKLSSEKVQAVSTFYYRDEVSKPMPGRKDYISIRKAQASCSSEAEPPSMEVCGKIKKQKRLILENLDELYRMFKNEHPDVSVSLSSFVRLRPRECVFATDSSAHSVCVCMKHENIKLQIEGSQMKKLNSEFRGTLDIVGAVMCSEPSTLCYLRRCEKCPTHDELRNKLYHMFQKSDIEEIKYYTWNNKSESSKFKRCSLEQVTQNRDDFIELFCRDVESFLPHHHINELQTKFWRLKKENLKEEEMCIQMDFSQNYAFIVQNAIQGYHWNNKQATLHTSVAYYKTENKIKTFSLLIPRLQKINPALKKLFYWTDGAASQYKNKKSFVNLVNHKTDFNIEASWHFSVKSHGKGPCDGLGGAVKRLARNASLKRMNTDQITTARKLFQWAQDTFENIYFDFVSEEEYSAHAKTLKNRFNQARTIPGTQKYHSAVPSSEENWIEMRVFSGSSEFEDHRIV